MIPENYRTAGGQVWIADFLIRGEWQALEFAVSGSINAAKKAAAAIAARLGAEHFERLEALYTVEVWP